MSWDKKSGKNPWGARRPGNEDRGPWGGGSSNQNRGGGGGQEPPDLDEMLRRAQENFGQILPGGWNSGKIIGLILVAIAALWLASGFYVVQPGEHAVIQKFGAWDRSQEESGLGYHMPWPVAIATIVNVQEIRRMNIGFNEAVSSTGRSASRDVPEESLMLTSDRNIVDLDLVIQWNIKNAEQYLFEIEDQEGTIKKVAESAIREVVGQTDMFPIITRARDTVANRTKMILQENLDEYNSGVNITQVLIERAEVHPDVQSAFQDVQSAKQDAEDVQNRAEAYREDILPKARGRAIQMTQDAEGYKRSTVAKAQGDAQRFNSIYQSYLSGKEVTKERMFIETMENVLKNAQKIILDDSGKNGSGVVPYLPLNEMKKQQSQSQ